MSEIVNILNRIENLTYLELETAIEACQMSSKADISRKVGRKLNGVLYTLKGIQATLTGEDVSSKKLARIKSEGDRLSHSRTNRRELEIKLKHEILKCHQYSIMSEIVLEPCNIDLEQLRKCGELAKIESMIDKEACTGKGINRDGNDEEVPSSQVNSTVNNQERVVNEVWTYGIIDKRKRDNDNRDDVEKNTESTTLNIGRTRSSIGVERVNILGQNKTNTEEPKDDMSNIKTRAPVNKLNIVNKENDVISSKIKRVAVYQSSFDPITNRDLHIINRIRELFSAVIVIVENRKKYRYNIGFDARKSMVLHGLKEIGLDNIKIEDNYCSAIDYIKNNQGSFEVRVIDKDTNICDMIDEYKLNKLVNSQYETICITLASDVELLTSRRVIEVYQLGGDISNLVPFSIINNIKVALK